MDLTGIKNKGGKPIGQEIYATLRSNPFVVDEKYVRATKNNEDSTLAEVNADFNSRISTLETNGGSLDPQGGVTKDYVDGLYNQTVTALNGKVNKAGEAQDITSDITFKDGFWITDGVDTASIALEEKLNIYTVGLGLSTDAGVYAKSFVKDGGTAQEVLLADGTTKALNEIGADTNQKVKAGDVTFDADDVVEFVAGNNVTIEGNAADKQITISSTGGNGIDYIEIAEGANNGEIKYRASSTGEYTNVTVHGLGDLAYKNAVGYDDLDNTAKGVLDSATGVSSTVDTLSDNLTSHIRNTDIHVTANDKTKWDGAVYGIKLSNGSENLPKSEGIVTLPFTATGDVIKAGDNTVGTAAIIDGAVTEGKLTDDLKAKVNYTYTLPTASSSQLGGVKVGSNLSISEGVLSATIPTKTSQLTNDSNFVTSDTASSTYATKTDIEHIGDNIDLLQENKLNKTAVTSTYSSTGTDPVNGKAIADAIGGLDVASVGGSDKYIQAISLTDGKISAIAATLPVYTASNVKMTGYDNSDLTGNVAASDTILNAIGKVENQATAARAETSALDNRVTTLESSVTSNATAIAGKADKSATVSTIAYDTTSKKITKTINGTSSDVVTAAKIVADGGGLTSNDLPTLVQANDKGAANGVAPLNASRKIDADYLPSYVDDVIEGYYYNSKFYTTSAHTTVITGETGKIYVDLSTNKTYRWSGSAFIEISTSNAGTVTSVAMTVPTGLSVSGSPITSTGTLALGFANGYSIPTTAKLSNWDTAYSWGNHAAAGYKTTDTNQTLKVGTVTFGASDVITLTSSEQSVSIGANATSKTINLGLNVANANHYGGIKLGYTQTGKNYPVLVTGGGQAYVNVPWTDTTYTVPTKVSQLINDSGFTSNAGTITDVRVGGVSQVSGGVADITIGSGTLTAKFPSGIGNKTFNADQRSAESWDLTGLALSSLIPTYTAVSGGPTGNATLTSGSTFTVPQVSQTTGGQVAVTNRTMTMPTIPAAVTESTVSNWGFTKNSGTVTDVKIGGTSIIDSSGVADITIGGGTLTATFPSGIGNKTFNADQRSNGTWDLTGLALSSDIPTLASLMGATAIGSSSEPIYWDGSAFAAATSTSGNVSEMTGATNTTAGTAGIVPRPLAGDQNRFLCGTGSWEDIKVDVGERVSSNSTSSSYGFITPWPGLRYYDTSVNGLCIGVDRITDGLGYRWESADGFTVRYGNGGTLYPVCKRRGSTVDMPRYKDLDPTLDQGYSFYNTDMHKQLYAEILVQNMQYAISGTTQQVTVYSYRWKDSGGYTWAVSNHVDYNGNLYRNGSKITLNRSNDPCMIRLDNLLGFYVGSTHYDWGSSTNIVIDASIEYGILTTHDIGRVFAANGTKAMMLTSIQEEDTTISTGEESLTLTCTFTACDGSDLSYTRECVVNNISYE